MDATFAAWLNEQIKHRGWSLRGTADALGVSHTTIVNLANGTTKPSLRMCKKLAAVFEVDPDEVIVRAGLLPARSNVLPEVIGWSDRLRALSPEARAELVRIFDQMLTVAEMPSGARRS